MSPLRRYAAVGGVGAAALAVSCGMALAQSGETPAPGETPSGSGQTPGPGGQPNDAPPREEGWKPPKDNNVPPVGDPKYPICVERVDVVVTAGVPLTLNGNCYSPRGLKNTFSIGCDICYPEHVFFGITQPAEEVTHVTLTPKPPEFRGTDFFAYRASNGTLETGRYDSNRADVWITVADEAPSAAWTGTDGDDELEGTEITDTFRGGDGEDLLEGAAGSDDVNGAAGEDVLNAGPGNDEIDGGPGADVIDAGPGNDEITDTSGGGASVAAKAKGNKVRAGSGKDRINVRNGRKDKVDCGTGKDRVKADKKDKVMRNCERVSRPKRPKRK